MLLKLLFVFSVILSSISELEIASNADHDLSLMEVNLVTIDEVSNSDLDLDPPFASDNWSLSLILPFYNQSVINYKGPYPTKLYFVNAHSRAPPFYLS